MRPARRRALGVIAAASAGAAAGLPWPAFAQAGGHAEWIARPSAPIAGSSPQAAGRPLRVVASFSILADIVRNVAGPAASVSELVGPDADAHVFEPTPRDAARVAEADLVVINGLRFEGWIERLIRAAGYRGPVVVASRGVAPRQLRGSDDPHAWQSLAHARVYAANVAAALAAARPGEQAALSRRSLDYLARIDALDQSIRTAFAATPRERRRVITSHDAFGYFGDAYGIDFLAAQGTGTQSDPSAAGVARLADQIQRLGVRAVFIENISDPRLVERLAKEGGARVGGKLYSDALSAPGSAADTFLKLYAHNAATIASTLRGEKTSRIRPQALLA